MIEHLHRLILDLWKKCALVNEIDRKRSLEEFECDDTTDVLV